MALNFYDKKTYTVYLNSEDRINAYTQSYGANCTSTGSVSGRQITIGAPTALGNATSNIIPGMIVTGNYFLNNTYITSQASGTTGQAGVYNLNYAPSEPATFVISSISSNIITVSSVSVGTLGVGMMLTPIANTDANYENATLPSQDAWWIPPSTYIISLGTGTGGAGTYYLNQYLPTSLLYTCYTFTLNTSFTGNVSGNQLTVTAVGANNQIGAVFTAVLANGSNAINITSITTPGSPYIACYSGCLVTGTGIPANTYLVSQTSGTAGGTGNYTMNNNASVSGPISLTQVGFSLIPGMVISSQYTAPNCYIISQSSGTTGGIGVYTLSFSTSAPASTAFTGQSTILNMQTAQTSTYSSTAYSILTNSYCGFDACTIALQLTGFTSGLGFWTLKNTTNNTGLINNPFSSGGVADFYQQYNVGTGMLTSTYPQTSYTGSWGEMDAIFTAIVNSSSQLQITSIISGALALPTGSYTGSQIYYNGNLVGTVSTFSGYNYQGLTGTLVNLASAALGGLQYGSTYTFTSITADENWNTATEGTMTFSLPSNNYNIYNSIVNNNVSLRNTATFQINWADILPLEYQQYKVIFSFQTSGGAYKDITTVSPNTIFSQAKIFVNFQGRSYSFDTGTKGHSTLMGVILRDIQTSTSNSNNLSCYYMYNPPKTVDRPNQNNITVSLVNTNNNLPIVDTYGSGTTYLAQDMTPWTMIIEFVPIEDSKIAIQDR